MPPLPAVNVRELRTVLPQLQVTDNGDGVVGPEDRFTDANGRAVPLPVVRGDFFVQRTRQHLDAYTQRHVKSAQVPAGVPQPSKDTLLARVSEIRAAIAERTAAGAADPRWLSEAHLTISAALGMAVKHYGSRTLGIPNRETQQRGFEAFKAIHAALAADPSNENARISYAVALACAYWGAPKFYHDDLSESFGVDLHAELARSAGLLADAQSTESQLALAMLLSAVKNKPDEALYQRLEQQLARHRPSDATSMLSHTMNRLRHDWYRDQRTTQRAFVGIAGPSDQGRELADELLGAMGIRWRPQASDLPRDFA